ncbi:MAG: tRNA pseudouridine(55) synthase TruB [Spirochaetota bacterium]|nr:MAG: tRNA pseudouridine(55) synthase TruB [Spirochaetota bacterium]
MAIDGIILIDKDEGMTSFEVVRKIKGRFDVQKAGHAGTLDKAASGLLIVCINRATAVQNIFMSNFKIYQAVLSLGKETDTLDSHGRIVREERVEEYSDTRIIDILQRYTGKIYQTPPAFSAIHYKGERLYKKALRGEVSDIAPREVEVKTLKLLKNKRGEITFEACTSKGTYIRSLARDIANALGTCGHLSTLRRLEIGPFSVKEAVKLGEVFNWSRVISLGTALGYLPHVMVSQEEADLILNGTPPGKIFSEKGNLFTDNSYIRVLFEKRLIAIVEIGNPLKYFKVFRNLEVVHS